MVEPEGHTEIFGWIFVLILLGGMIWVLSIVIPDAYQNIRSYNIMQNECEANPDICFCDQGSCSVKSSCSYSKFNNEPMTGGCNTTRLCEIFKRADWKEGLWDYDC